MRLLTYISVVFLCLVGCTRDEVTVQKNYFEPTHKTAKPWVYWYWMQSAYSKEGITADLEAMKEAGIEGAYLMSIKGPADPPLINPPILQLSKEWWDMVGFAIKEADRLGLQIAMHAADGFAVAGGPWITPEQSMQKVVWADTMIVGGKKIQMKLPQPEMYNGYYKDIATYAIPEKQEAITSAKTLPKVTSTITDFDASFLTDITQDGNFKLYEPGWVQYEFAAPFTCKSIVITSKGNNYQAQRLQIQVSDNGTDFKDLGRLNAPRHGWQDTDAPHTFAIPPTTAKYFRFVYNPEETEPGAEDLDAAKWKQSLKVSKIVLSNQSKIDNYEGKSGLVWRISPETTSNQIPDTDCVAKNEIVNVSSFVDTKGILQWDAPKGNWKIIRFGHTSTGHMNATGGAGKGLEVDKFNPEAIQFQFDKWYGECARVAGAELTGKVLSVLHLDSWECGSQNWSPVFQAEFKQRRGYNLIDYLPVMAGIPIDNVTKTEQVLYDVRKTISELLVANFFGTIRAEADKLGVTFSSENVAPTMVSDALLHFKTVDWPGGEFWLKSPTHDKPNDMLDAISGGHIYGKSIIQAEAFTELRMDWDEHPGNLKALADRNYALGINRFFFHVFVHNPWVDRKPGMTLDGVGLYFQRNQTWWQPGKAWIDYCKRVQYQLQKGVPVVDLAVFTGEELPSRAVLPDRLLPFIPNVFGEEKVAEEKVRLENSGQPTAKMPKEVTYAKNVTDLSHWVNALNGYKYDSFNTDVFLNATVSNGKVYFSGDIGYGALIFPDVRKMAPNHMMSLAVAEKMVALVKQGATVMVGDQPKRMPGLRNNQEKWQRVMDELWNGKENAISENGYTYWNIGKGKVVALPYLNTDFKPIGIVPDILFPDIPRSQVQQFAWNHRETAIEDVYFIANQKEEYKQTNVSFKITGKVPYLYNPVTDKTTPLKEWEVVDNRTVIPLSFDKNQSLFVIFKEKTNKTKESSGKNRKKSEVLATLDENWNLQFNPEFKGPKKAINASKLFDWSTSNNDSIKYYSGTVLYTKSFTWNTETENTFLNLGSIANIAEVKINGKSCGVAWTYPYQVGISDALKKGTNTIEIAVTNTWANRLMGDQLLPEEERLTWTTAPYRLQENELLKAGLFGPVQIIKENK